MIEVVWGGGGKNGFWIATGAGPTAREKGLPEVNSGMAAVCVSQKTKDGENKKKLNCPTP